MGICYCEDFNDCEPDSDVCECGHVLDEHEDKFFRRCTVEVANE